MWGVCWSFFAENFQVLIVSCLLRQFGSYICRPHGMMHETIFAARSLRLPSTQSSTQYAPVDVRTINTETPLGTIEAIVRQNGGAHTKLVPGAISTTLQIRRRYLPPFKTWKFNMAVGKSYGIARWSPSSVTYLWRFTPEFRGEQWRPIPVPM